MTKKKEKKYNHPALKDHNPEFIRYHVSLKQYVGKFDPLKYNDFSGLVTKEQYEAFKKILEKQPKGIELLSVHSTEKEVKAKFRQKTLEEGV